jgi:23S rRNA (pseudouridine1915-N3)-methyltransferase
MKIAVIAVGRMKSGPEQDLAARYLDRAQAMGKPLGFGAVTIRELNESRAGSAATRKRDEADRISAALPDGALVICLDETGKDWTSETFAETLGRARDDNVPAMAFVIGGADGLDHDFRDAHRTMRFGRMTLPHQIARIVLLEQIYRATTILAGHPYHRA